MLKHLSRRRFLQSSAMIAASAGVAAPRIARAEGTDIKALLITGGPLYPKYWEQIAQDFKKKTGITVNYDLLEFTPFTSKTVTLGAARSASTTSTARTRPRSALSSTILRRSMSTSSQPSSRISIRSRSNICAIRRPKSSPPFRATWTLACNIIARMSTTRTG